jgi:rSAM/selenodomain-associated transferase 1
MSAALAVFLKAPRMGTVKTRLASEIGARQALRLYRVMVARTLASAGDANLEVTVWFTPPEAAVEVRFWLGTRWDLRPQSSGDLGARLSAAEHAVPQGRPWIAIGVDCPRLTSELLREAVEIIQRGSIVLGPASDGGYYLIGGTTPLPGLFTDMPWGTDRVLSETRARLQRAGARWHELLELRDVDTAAAAKAEGLLT